MHTTADDHSNLPPSPADPEEAQRWEEGRRRRRLLDGCWRPDLKAALHLRIGTTRAQAWGEPILEVNPFGSICRELSVLYDQAPEIRHDQGDITAFEQAVRLSGVWGLMARVQRYTLGLRECLVRVHVSKEGRPSYRPVYPDLVVGEGRPDKPDIPSMIREVRLRTHPTKGTPAWTMDVLDVRKPDAPVYRVVEVKPGLKEGEDWTREFLGGPMSGDAYPYRRSDGRAILPYVLYHAERTGDRLWDPYTWRELVDGTYSLATKFNLLDHTFVQASWPQRWALGCQPAGGAPAGDGNDAQRRQVIVDPAVLLILEKTEDFEGQPQVGQFQPGGDVEKMEETLASQLARLAQDAGVPASDIQRLNSQRSGVSISLTNEGKRVQQRRFAQQFRDSDERLLATTAALMNRVRGEGSDLPEAAFTVAYKELPLSPDELAARRMHVLELLETGLIGRVQAYQELHPGITRAQAEADIAAMGRLRGAGIT